MILGFFHFLDCSSWGQTGCTNLKFPRLNSFFSDRMHQISKAWQHNFDQHSYFHFEHRLNLYYFQWWLITQLKMIFWGSLLKKILLLKLEPQGSVVIAFHLWPFCLMILAAKFGWDWFIFMPQIVPQLLHTDIQGGCALLLESEQTPGFWQVVNLDMLLYTEFDLGHATVTLFSYLNFTQRPMSNMNRKDCSKWWALLWYVTYSSKIHGILFWHTKKHKGSHDSKFTKKLFWLSNWTNTAKLASLFPKVKR